MKIAHTLTILILIIMSGCGTPSNYENTIKNTVKDEINVKTFNSIFSGSKNSIANFSGEYGPSSYWTSEAILYGRYILSMIFEVKIDQQTLTLKASADPTFNLLEIRSVTLLSSGRVEIKFNAQNDKKFGIDDWKKLITSKGDFSSIGIELVKDQPILGAKMAFYTFY